MCEGKENVLCGNTYIFYSNKPILHETDVEVLLSYYFQTD